MTSLDQRMDDLLGPVEADPAGCPVFLEMTEAMACRVVEGLRWALYGGAQPPDGRRALLLVLDSIDLALSHHEEHSP
ncbi:MAG: hypothetical protein LC798_21010 [Chloroflexi bacterium]|nr:hypothetical protein [Chloroflexota bacterium]